jgi:hypothetical protein
MSVYTSSSTNSQSTTRTTRCGTSRSGVRIRAAGVPRISYAQIKRKHGYRAYGATGRGIRTLVLGSVRATHERGTYDNKVGIERGMAELVETSSSEVSGGGSLKAPRKGGSCRKPRQRQPPNQGEGETQGSAVRTPAGAELLR